MGLYTDFIQKVKGRGFAQGNRYKVFINVPQNTGPSGTNYFQEYGVVTDGDTLRTFTLMCESTELPGKGITTTDVNIYGPTYSQPYNQIFNETNFVFRIGNDMNEKKFFDAWLATIIDPVTNDVNFYKEFVTDLEVEQLNRNEEAIYKVRLLEAFPTSINAISLDHTLPDVIQKISVNIKYRYWEPVNV